MHPSFKTIASMTLLFILTACGTLPEKNTPTNPQVRNLFIPSSPSDPLNIRAEADYNFILGEVYSREGSSARAIELFEKVVAKDQNSPTVHMLLSAEYLKIDKMTEAIFHAEQAVHKDPKNIETHLFLGGLYSEERLYDKAISQYNIVLRLQPKNEEALIYIGSLYVDKKDYKKAEQHFKSLLKFKPDFEDAVLSLANLYLQQKNRSKALSLCLEFQKRNQFNPNVADILAKIHIESGDFDKAYEQLEFITNNSDASFEVQMKMALILIEQKRFHLAESKLKEVVAKSPASDTARYYLAAVYEETGAVENAIHEYMLVSPSSEHFSEAVVHAAHLLKGLGKLNQALDLTKKGLKAKADQPQVYTMHASLLDAKSDYLEAARVLEEGLTKFSQNTGLLFQHALLLDRLGKKDVMISQMKKILEIEPNHVQSMNYLAFSLAELNQQLPEAERLARRALELEPKDGYVLDTLGWVLFKQKKFSESVQVLEKAYGYQSSASIIAEHLADAYSMQAMTKEAKAMYNKAADLTTNETRANQIRSKLSKLVF